MFGEKEISSGLSSNSLQLDGTLILFGSTSLFDRAQIGGKGTLVLEEGSVLDLRGVSGVYISPSLEMRENSSLMLEVDDRDSFVLKLQQRQLEGELNSERNISRGRMILSPSEGSRFEEGGVYTVISTPQKMIPFSSVKWERHRFEAKYNSSGMFVVFQGINIFILPFFLLIYLFLLIRNQMG